MTSVTLKAVSKAFEQPEGTRQILDSVDLELFTGHFVALIGPNGCGKTTLLNIIAGSVRPDAGSVEFDGLDEELPTVGYVWQNFADSLLPWFTVLDNIALPLRARSRSWEFGREKAAQLMYEFLPEVPLHSKTYELSGGQQQLVSLFRAVVAEPDILLLDEPFSALDQHRSWNMALFVERIWSQRKIPILFVSHDVDEAVLLADEVVFLSKTKRSFIGTVSNNLTRPRKLNMLTDPTHLRCRNEIVEFFQRENSNRNSFDFSNDASEEQT